MTDSADSTPAAPAPQAVETPPVRRVPRSQAVEELFRKAVTDQRAGRLEDAVRGYGLALSLNPRETRVANNMAVALRALGRREAAEALYRRVLGQSPESVSTLVNLGNVLRDLGRLDEAVDCHRKALSLAPDTRGAHYGLGLCYRDMKRLPESIAALERVLAIAPDDREAVWDMAQSLLTAEHYALGWEAYEARWDLPAMERPDFGLPDWDGAPLDGRVLLLYGEQGFGDVLQFARFVGPALALAGGEAVLMVRPQLVPLLDGQLPGVRAVVARGQAVAGCDLQAPLLSLPRLLGVGRDDIPPPPYLRAPERSITPPPRPPEIRRVVGLCWQGSPTQKNDRNRSLPFAALLPLLGRDDTAFVSLQKGEAAADPARQGVASLVPSLDAVLNDFADTAAVVAKLDLVITADTSVLHVAGALGKPVWVLLSVFHDWRFNAEDSIAAWYPQARVFKQETPGDWTGVVARVQAALEDLAAETEAETEAESKADTETAPAPASKETA